MKINQQYEIMKLIEILFEEGMQNQSVYLSIMKKLKQAEKKFD